MTMPKPVRICAKIFGLVVDEKGNKTYAGVEVKLGESNKEIDYKKLTESVDKSAFLKMFCLDGIATAKDVVFIAPQEYDKEFGKSREV